MFRNRLGYGFLYLLLLLLSACGGGGSDVGSGGVDTSTTYAGSGQLSSTGGEIVAQDVTISVPADRVIDTIDVSVSEGTLPTALPAGLRQIDDVLNIDISDIDQSKLNSPLNVTLRYDDTGIQDENDLLVLHYDQTANKYGAVRILSQDTAANTITFESRTFSPFVLALIDTVLPTSYDSGFLPTSNGWNINNFGSFFSPGGNCLGMSGYAAWFFDNRNDSLNGKFTDQIAKLTVIRAHLAQSQSWAIAGWREEQSLSTPVLGRLMKAYMVLLNEPLIFLAGIDGSPRHAMVLTGYDENGFNFYDVNLMNQSQSLTFNGTSFGTYGSYNTFGYVAVASLGRSEDFANLTSEAESGFTSSDDIMLTSPTEGEVISSHQTQLEGTLSGSLNNEVKLYAYVKGIPRQLSVTNGVFSDEIEISNGTNSIILLAGVDISSQSNWFQNGATLIRDVEGTLPSTKLLVTLTWDQDGTDVDLYVTEPNGETAWYRNMATTSGLTLDFDDTSGLGPEHTTLTENATADNVQTGDYLVRVHYYADHSTGLPATGTVSIVVNEGQLNQVERTFPFSIATSDSSADGPDGTGATWADIAIVNPINGVITPL